MASQSGRMRLGFSVLGGGHKLGEHMARLGSSPLVAVVLLVVGLGVVAGVLVGRPMGLTAGADRAPTERNVVLLPAATDTLALRPPALPATALAPARLSATPPIPMGDAAADAPAIAAPASTGATGNVVEQVAADERIEAARTPTAPAPRADSDASPAPTSAPAASATMPADTAVATRIVAGAGVNVRAGPSTASDRLFALGGGQRVTVTGIEQGWIRVVDAEGRSGWVYEKFLLMPP